MTIFDLIVEDALNEISPEQAYDNFYNSIPREDFNKIVEANGKFDALVKFLLGEYMKDNTNLEECLELIKVYKTIDNKARITVSDKLKKKDYESIDELIYDLTHTEEITRLSKSSLIKNGYEEIARIGNWILTATFTYEANRKYFGYTQWCTASDRLGDYDGYEQFVYYTVDSIGALIQMTSEKDKNITYQMQITKFGTFGQICDVKDNSMSSLDLKKCLYDNTFDSLTSIIKENYMSWIKNTKELHKTEEEYQISMQKYWDAKLKRREAKKRRLEEESKQLNIRLCQETEKKYNELKDSKLYENLDFLNSLKTFSEVYSGDNVEEIEEYFKTHYGAIILEEQYLPNNLLLVEIIVKVPYYYRCNDSVVLEKYPDCDYTSWYNYDINDYTTKGFAIIVEEGDENSFKRFIRSAFDIDSKGGFYFSDSISTALKNRAFCFSTDSTKGLLYLPSNGKTYKLEAEPFHYGIVETGDNIILHTSKQFFIFSNNMKELLDYECSYRCATEIRKICVISHAKDNNSVLYTDNSILYGGKLVINEKIEFLTNFSTISCGAFVMASTFNGRNFGIIIDMLKNNIYTVFDREDDSKAISMFCDGDNYVYTVTKEKSILFFDVRTRKYFISTEGGKEECDMYGNIIKNPQA